MNYKISLDESSSRPVYVHWYIQGQSLHAKSVAIFASVEVVGNTCFCPNMRATAQLSKP